MRTTWTALAWKEWNEHQWKLVSTAAIFLSMIGVSLFLTFDEDTIAVAAGLIALSAFPLTLFIAAGTGTGERARNTYEFMQSLPVPMWRVAVEKLLFGWLACVLPILLAMLALAAVYQIWVAFNFGHAPRLFVISGDGNARGGFLDWLLWTNVPLVLGVTSVYLWTAAVAVNRKDEVSGGAWALLIIVSCWAIVVVLVERYMEWMSSGPEALEFSDLLSAASPGGLALNFLNRPNQAPVGWWPVAVAIVVHVALAARFILRFGNCTATASTSRRAATSTVRSSDLAPWRTPFAAIVWKQLRESAPIVAVGLLGVAAFLVLMTVIGTVNTLRDTGAMLFILSCYFGAAVTMLVAIGAFLYDMSPALQTFWRSRPVNPDLWFWAKAISALAVLWLGYLIPFGFAISLGKDTIPEFKEAAPWILLSAPWIFASFVLLTCLVRQAIYAAVLGLGAMFTGFMTIAAIVRAWMLRGTAWDWDTFWSLGPFENAIAIVTMTILYTILAWLAVRFDWGWKQRA